MPTLNKPADPSGRAFENLCLLVFGQHFAADDANFYGRPGVGQNGIDIRLTNRVIDRNERVVIQCKDVQTLKWKTIKPDFEAALEYFAPRAADDPDLFFITATTDDGANTKDIDAKAARAIAALKTADPSIDTGRIRHQVFAWRWIEQTV